MLMLLRGQYWMSASKGEGLALEDRGSKLTPLRQLPSKMRSTKRWGAHWGFIKNARIQTWARAQFSPTDVLFVAPSDMWWERVAFEPSNILQRLGVSVYSFIHESRYYLKLTYKLFHFHSLPGPWGLPSKWSPLRQRHHGDYFKPEWLQTILAGYFRLKPLVFRKQG